RGRTMTVQIATAVRPQGDDLDSVSPVPPDRRAFIVRVASHAAVVIPFAYGLIGALSRSWIPTADIATIAVRSWDVFGSYAPLVGQRTGLPHSYDLGPLEYWLLSIPVRIDPEHGALWGAALFATVAAWLSIEAARRAFGSAGGVVCSAAIVACMVWMPKVADDPAWNPHFGLLWFFAVLAGACAVCGGSLRWWPVLVASASVASQCHLIYAVDSVALVVISLGVALGYARRARTGYWFAFCGLGVGLVCWAAPIYQELATRAGNLTVLVSASHAGGDLGAVFGLKTFVATVLPPMLWCRDLQAAGPTQIETIVRGVYFPLVLVALAVTVGPLFVGRRFNSSGLRAAALVSIVSCAAVALTFAQIPSSATGIPRMVEVVYPVGALAWVSLVWAVCLVVRASRLGEALGLACRAVPRRARRRVASAVLLLALAAAASVLEIQGDLGTAYPWRFTAAVSTASSQIEHSLPPGPVYVRVIGNIKFDLRYAVTTGIVYQLKLAGYSPEVSVDFDLAELGPGYRRSRLAPSVIIDVHRQGATATVTTRLRKPRKLPAAP
ncbi:MAG TPA: hypothetical protein VGP46_06295, partial [Acidimicrobiales bacterium]|nr:hypothetical protein [Acidimicrobiales bacterium]